MLFGESDLNTSIVFLSGYDSPTSQYDPSSSIPLLNFQSKACFFFQIIVLVFHPDKRRKGRHNSNKNL